MAQVGGKSVNSFLNLPASARVTANSGDAMPIWGNDLTFAYHNPSLLNPQMHNKGFFSNASYVQSINFGTLAYAYHKENMATFQGGIHYSSFGTFVGTDETGQVTGEFNGNDIAFFVGASRPYGENYNYGVNLKLISSNYADRNAFALATDWAASYHDTAKNFSASLLLKNIGFQFKPLIPNNRESLPFEVQLGLSKKLKHVPFRISVLASNLQRWDLTRELEEENPSQVLFGDSSSNPNGGSDFFDNVARHLSFSGELYLGKLFTVAFGYSHQRRKELSVPARKGLTGFTFGVGMKIKMFEFWYGRGRYHIAGASDQITVSIDINRFMKKNRIQKELKPIVLPDVPSNGN